MQTTDFNDEDKFSVATIALESKPDGPSVDNRVLSQNLITANSLSPAQAVTAWASDIME